MKLPESIKPVWRTIQIIRISKGLDDGLRTFIVGPYFYEIFKKLSGEENALLYASVVWALYSGLLALLEIPTGLFSDVFGRARSVTYCFVFNLIYALGLASLVLINHSSVVFALVILISFARAAGVTLYNGSFTAWVVDNVREHCPEYGYDRLLAKGYTYYSLSMIIGALMGITLYLYGVAYAAFIIGGFVCLNCATFCGAEMKENRSLDFSKLNNFWGEASSRLTTTLGTAVRVCHKVPAIWWLLLIYASYTFLYNAICYLWPIALGSLYGTSRWSSKWYIMAFGVPAGCALGSQLLVWCSTHYHKKNGKRLPNASLMKWIVGSCLWGAIPIMLLGISQLMGHIPFWIFASGILALQSTNGMLDSAYSALLNAYIPDNNSQERSTIMSVGTMLQGVLLMALLVPSSTPTGVAGVIGWLLPSSLLLIVLAVAVWRIRIFNTAQRREEVHMLQTDPN